jgi:hypothetical protein
MDSGRLRRIAGALVLAAALVMAFLVARGASFPVAGHPVAGWPPPPVVGSCRVLDGDALDAVPCGEQHDLEITRTWQAFDTVPKDLATICQDAAVDYLGAAGRPTGVQGWALDPPQYSAYQWTAPPSETVGGRGWAACVITPWRSGQYTGSIRDLASPADRPAAFGVCGFPDQPILVRCDQPHGWERLGTLSVDLASSGDSAGMARAVTAHQASCRSLAVALIGVADPTYGNRLQIVVDAQAGYALSIGGRSGASGPPTGAATTPATAGTAITGTAPTSAGSTASPSGTDSGPTSTGQRARPVALLSCQVLDTRGQLVGSLMGWGDRSLPTK